MPFGKKQMRQTSSTHVITSQGREGRERAPVAANAKVKSIICEAS